MNRAELARQAWAILLSSPGLRHDFEPEYVADCAVKSADALLSALQITPETVAESQQASAGIIKPQDEIMSLRYTMAMHMLREIQHDEILALVPNTGNGIGEFWDVVKLDFNGECLPYDGDKRTEHLWLRGRDQDPLNAVFQAGRNQ